MSFPPLRFVSAATVHDAATLAALERHEAWSEPVPRRVTIGDSSGNRRGGKKKATKPNNK